VRQGQCQPRDTVPPTPVWLTRRALEGGPVVLTPKFGKESDLWVRPDEESVRWKEGFSQMYSAERSAVGYLLPFGKGTVELMLRV
jgi:hypothetical protein